MKNIIELGRGFDLRLEFDLKDVRLVVLKGQQELGCSKEKLVHLQNFLHQESGSLFKGRLQLEKKSSDIKIIFKKEVVGTIYYREFERNLQIA